MLLPSALLLGPRLALPRQECHPEQFLDSLSSRPPRWLDTSEEKRAWRKALEGSTLPQHKRASETVLPHHFHQGTLLFQFFLLLTFQLAFQLNLLDPVVDRVNLSSVISTRDKCTN